MDLLPIISTSHETLAAYHRGCNYVKSGPYEDKEVKASQFAQVHKVVRRLLKVKGMHTRFNSLLTFRSAVFESS